MFIIKGTNGNGRSLFRKGRISQQKGGINESIFGEKLRIEGQPGKKNNIKTRLGQVYKSEHGQGVRS